MKASPVFDVINIAAAIAGLVPSIAATITSIVVAAATKIAIEAQTRQRYHKTASVPFCLVRL